ncbi:MAG: alpha/beta hydrolase [Acidobacteriota bacterium]
MSDLFAGAVGAAVTAYLRLRKSAAMQAATRRPGAFAGLDPEHVWVESEGRKLSCLLVRGEPGRGVWLLAHGLGENRWQMASRAEWFRGRGCSVMLFDFRAHGESDWGPVAFGRLEAADVDEAVKFLDDELPGEAISFCGVSLGASAGVMSQSAGRFKRLILELPYRRLEDAVMERARRWLTPLSFPVARAYLRRLERESPGPDPLEAVTKLPGRLLLLAGARDLYSPLAQVRDVARAAGVETVEFAGLKHQNLHRLAKDEWERAVQRFWDDDAPHP